MMPLIYLSIVLLLNFPLSLCVILTDIPNLGQDKPRRLLNGGAGITEVVTEVSTREGKYAILPCSLDFPGNLKDEVFAWKKEQQEVFFYEKGKDYNNQGRPGPDPQFVGRVHLLPGGLQAGKASMILSNVTQADSGVYKCIILLPTRQTRWIRLTVVVEPQLRLEVKEASPSSGWVWLSCLSSGGQPQPSGLEWQTPNGTVIPAEEAPTAISSDGDGRYSISQTVKVTEPGNYTCLARQQGVHPAVRDTIRVVGHREEGLWYVTWAPIGLVLSIMAFGLNLYNFIQCRKRSKVFFQPALLDAGR